MPSFWGEGLEKTGDEDGVRIQRVFFLPSPHPGSLCQVSRVFEF